MRYLKLIAVLLLVTILQSCTLNNPKYITLGSKPNDYYYSSLVYEKLKKNHKFSLKVFDGDMYKYYAVDESDNDILISFFESLDTKNYVPDETIPEKAKYELLIEFNDSKFIINAYNRDFITLYPWDGSFKEDKVSLSGVSTYNNIYDFCTYVINKAHSR